MQTIQFFKALSDLTRLKIVMLIYQEDELCVCELMASLGENQPNVSRHLGYLKRIGLLVDRKQKQWIYYRIEPTVNTWMQQTIAEACAENELILSECRIMLKGMGERPTLCL